MIVGGLLLALSLSPDQFPAALALGISGLPRHRWARTAAVFYASAPSCRPGLLAGRALTATLGSVATYLAGGILVVIRLRGLAEAMWAERDEVADCASDAQRSRSTTPRWRMVHWWADDRQRGRPNHSRNVRGAQQQDHGSGFVSGSPRWAFATLSSPSTLAPTD